ncbi:MAG: hypothetical protein Q9167_004627 [Letrouitia subvulpina]
MENLAEVAPVLLGSTWFKAAESRKGTILQPASSGCHFIDSKVLDGGFRYGEITSITGTKGSGKTTLALQAVASHLLFDDHCEVAFVDTTGSLDLLRLRNVIASQMRKRYRETDFLQSEYMYRKKDVSSSATDELVKNQIDSVLDRIKLMRVFDFTGLVEAVSEIGAKWERASNYIENEIEKVDERQQVITSSEEVLEDDEQKSQNNEILPPSGKTPLGDGDNISRIDSANMIVIDSIVNVVEVVMSQSRIQG